MAKLKRCPIPGCGGSGRLVRYEASTANCQFCIECVTCRYRTEFYKSKEQAIDAWNRREK